MKFYVEYWTANRVGSKTFCWDIIEFDFRKDISKEAIIKQICPAYEPVLQVTNILKL